MRSIGRGANRDVLARKGLGVSFENRDLVFESTVSAVTPEVKRLNPCGVQDRAMYQTVHGESLEPESN